MPNAAKNCLDRKDFDDMKRIIHMKEENELMNYEVYTPEVMTEHLPMIVFLHGAGERGWNIDHLAKHGIPMMIKNGAQIPAVVLCPQCPANCVWDNIPFDVMALIEKTAAEYKVDPDRISVTGGSMGGFGTWTLGLTFPTFFSAMAPMAGGGMSWRCENLRTTPIRAYHGEKDGTVPLIYSELMVEAVNKTGGSASLTVLAGYGHNDGINAAYTDTDIIEWLLSMKRTDRTPIAEALSKYF